MGAKQKKITKQFLGTLALFIAIWAAFLLYDLTLGGGRITSPGLAGSPAAYNALASSLYGVEIPAFISAAILLCLVFRKRYGKLILPWLLAALVAIFLWWHWYMALRYPESPIGFPGGGLMYYYNMHDLGDPALQSMWGVFLLFQVPFIAALALGFTVLWLVSKRRQKSHLSTET